MTNEAGRVIAACFALSAFAVAVVSGLSSGNGAAQILLRAVLAMIVCYPLGLVAGLICDGVIRQHVLARAAAESPVSASTNIEAEAEADAAMAGAAAPREARAAA